MKRRWLMVFILALVFVPLAQGIAGAAGPQQTEQKENAADPESKELELRDLLLTKLGHDALGIRVTVDRTTAILTGTVPTRSAQELAEEVAFSFEGIKKVDNRVKVDPKAGGGTGEKAGRTADQETADAALEIKVKRSLFSELGKRARDIEVEAVDGVVSLRGTVPDSARKQIALTAANQTKGVQRVIDLIKVK